MIGHPLRGEIWLTNLGKTEGSEQAGIRPCVIVQNNKGNASSETTVAVPMTTAPARNYEFHVTLEVEETGLLHRCTAKCEQVRTLSFASRLIKLIGQLTPEAMFRLEEALLFELGIDADDHAGGDIGFDVQ